MYEGKLK